jgi:DUF4097 and DUF4098 domain-containing protein YvlB
MPMKRMLLFAAVLGLLPVDVARAGRFERTIAVDPGGRLRIELAGGEVSVTSHAADAVRIEADAEGWPWTAEFDLEQDGDEIRLTDSTTAADGLLAGVVRAALWPFHFHAQVQVRAWVPARYAVDVHTRGGRIDVSDVGGDVAVETRGGAISVSRVAGDVTAETAGGAVRVSDLRGGVRAHTRGGPIGVARVSGPVDVETRGGPITVEQAGASVVAETRGGSIDVGFAASPAGAIETRGGAIQVRIPTGAGVDLDAASSSGPVRIAASIAVDGSTDSRRYVGKLNGGGAALRLRTAGGGIDVGSP